MRLRRLTVGAVALASFLALVPADAGDGQQERGLLISTKAKWEGCGGYLGAVTQTAARVNLGYVFSIQENTWGMPFTLKADSPEANFDLGFWLPGQQMVRYESSGNESGIVPEYAAKAEVCLNVGLPDWFTYRADSKG